MTDYPRLARLLDGRKRYHDIPARSARAKEIVKRVRPWEGGRIGRIETHIARLTIMGGRDYTTSELARVIYCDPMWDQNYNFRNGKPPPKLKSWQYHRVRLSAPTFCDCVGRSTAKGTPYLWRPRPGVFFSDVRDQKRVRDAERRAAKSDRPKE
jgi:hypothetical protein